jgi:hypothetical protein
MLPVPRAFSPRIRYTFSMPINLTTRAEELLRKALARHPGSSPEEILEKALAELAGRELGAPPDAVWQRLKAIPGVKLPDRWPPRFEKFEPLRVEGEPVSEQLIRERR